MLIAWDTETALIRPGMMAPELSCVTHASPGSAPGIVHHTSAEPLLRAWLMSPAILVGHNVAFDLAVAGASFPSLIPLIFEAYDHDRVTDTMLRQKLLDIAAGHYRGKMEETGRWLKYEYSLDAVTRRLAGRTLDKDTWRLKYGTLRHLPLEEWPEGARVYPLEDAKATLDVYLAQEHHAEFLADQFRQARAAFALHLCSAWGLRTRPEGVEHLKGQTIAALKDVEARLVAAGLVRKDGSRDTKKAKAHMVAVCQAEGRTVRMTEKGQVSLDSDACDATEDELLEDYAAFSTLAAVLNKDVPMLAAGSVYPVHTRFDIADTGRSTSSKPNVQNPRRLPGIRECFVPREGRVFAQCDYPQLELYTLAQVCKTLFGHSALADALNGGLDPHTAVAAQILGVSYAEAMTRRKSKDSAVDDARQTAKVANFGFPGGLGAKKLVLFARKSYGVILTEERAQALRATWLATWPEMSAYFDYVNRLPEGMEGRVLRHLFTDRVRGGASYTAACNSHFQGLGADAAKAALWLIQRACYVGPSPMFGARPVNFVHDEVIVECADDARAHDVATELARLMAEGANAYLPDVRIKTEKMDPLLMRYWSKEAAPVFDADGRLVPWEGKKK